MAPGNPNTLHLPSAALLYARQSWPVIPLHTFTAPRCGCGRLPGKGPGQCASPGKHPRTTTGLTEATSDTATVEAWWQRWPDANIGIRTGSRAADGAGVWALDLDAGTEAADVVMRLAIEHGDSVGDILNTRRARTGGGGLHLVYRFGPEQVAWLASEGRTLRNQQGANGIKGVDIRGDGGYILVSPSTHKSGGRYAWEDTREPVDAPEWLLRWCSKPIAPVRPDAPTVRATLPGESRERKYGAAVLRGAVDRIASATVGGKAGDGGPGRHGAILKAAYTVGGYIACGAIDENEAVALLIAAGATAGKPDREIRRAVVDSVTAGKLVPLAVPADDLSPLGVVAVELFGELPGKGDPRWKDVGRELRRREQEANQPPPMDDDGAPWMGEAPTPDDGPPPHEDHDAPHVEAPVGPPEWEPPTPLDEMASLPPFPVHCLPGALRVFVEAVAEETQTPADMAALFALAIVGVVLQGRVEAFAWWAEPVNLYGAAAMDPGSRKSAVVGHLLAPIIEAERDDAIRMKPEIRAAKVKIKVLDDRMASAQAQAAKAKNAFDLDTGMQEAIRAAEDRDAVTMPLAKRYFGDDVTPEKLIGLIADHGGRFAVISAEGGPFDMMAGRYSDSPNFDVYLKGHAGDPIRVDRMGRPSEQINRPALSIALAIQPDVVRNLADKPGFRGKGLLARFLFVVPPSKVGSRNVSPATITEMDRRAYHDLIHALIALPLPAESIRISLSADARESLRRFMVALEPRLGAGGDLAHMADWGGKLAGAILRMSILLHMADRVHESTPWTTPVSVYTLDSAIEIGVCLTEHARAAFAMMGADPDIIAAGHLLAWILRMAPDGFIERDAFNATRGRFKTMTAFRVALAKLTEHGYVRIGRRETQKKAGRKPSPRYEVNQSRQG